jgi:predicted unusual protein kinase regulating ubiquinone biosynthesis (AarF/ABC1/UbiB family)
VNKPSPEAFDFSQVAEAPIPFPRFLPKPTKAQLAKRWLEITTSTARHFGPLAARETWSRARRRGSILAVDDAWAAPLRAVFEDLGATFMKLGQILGSSPSVFGERVSAEFRACLDTGPAEDVDLIRTIVEADLGMALEDAFAEFNPRPIGQASIAVVHRARLHDGRDVAVKVLRPGIEEQVSTDLDLMAPLISVLARQVGPAAAQLLQLLDGFRAQVAEELDLRNEARAMAHYLGLLDLVDLPLVTVPKPVFEFSGIRTLTMEYLDGVPIDDLAAISNLGIDPTPIVEQVVRAFLVTAVLFGTFHGDVHSGNLLMLRDGRIGVLDWGIVGRLDASTHHFFRSIIAAALGHEAAWDDILAHFERTYGSALAEGFGLEGPALSAFIRSVMEPVLNQPFGQVSIGDMLMAPQKQVDVALGLEVGDRSVRAKLRRWQTHRRLRAQVEAMGTLNGATFDRGTFLLGKQLLYFERYGKLFLADRSLFEDRAFFEALLLAPIPAALQPKP